MTHTDILANLEEIENVARMACRLAYDCRDLHPELGAVNWADFAPYEVRYFLTKDEEGFEVMIDEASPDNGSLENWFRKFFMDRGYKNPPEFRFEW